MMKIIVPATSANLGAGFDSIGLAVNRYLEIELLDESQDWKVEHDLPASIPTDEQNLIVATALQLAPALKPHRLKMTSDIPLEHGLGSSSSAIIAGIELADSLGQLQLNLEQKLQLACQIEGHPDNVAPALLGGLVVASYSEDQLTYSRLSLPNCALVATIPPYSVPTKKAREVLPKEFSHREAVKASSRANVLVASLATGDLTTVGQMMEQDLFHEKYRAGLIPELPLVREIAHRHQAYGTHLSGAGPTILTWLPVENVQSLIEDLQKQVEAELAVLEAVEQGSYHIN